MTDDSSNAIPVSACPLVGGSRTVHTTVVIIFLLSIIIRLILVLAANPVLVSDARDYHVSARNIAEGRGYVQVYQGETKAFEGFVFRAFRPPGYPLFLAALYSTFGWDTHVALLANIVADLVVQVCFLLIAAHLFGVGAALFVQILLAIHVLWTPNQMTESLYTALFALLAFLLVLGWPLKSWRMALGFGLIAAVALFVRPITMCVFPALLWKYIQQNRTKHGALLLALTVLPSVIGISAWSVRNYRLFGEFVPLTTNFGHHNAWDYGLQADHEFAALRAQGMNEAQINQALMKKEWAIAGAHPVAWLVTTAQRAASLFSLTPAREVENVLWAQTFATEPDTSLVGSVYSVMYKQYYVTYILAACGAVLLGLRRRGLSGLWSLMLFYVILHALVSRGDIRLAAPLYPLMCVLASALCPSSTVAFCKFWQNRSIQQRAEALAL